MGSQSKGPTGPDLTQGISAADLRGRGHIAGHVGKDDVLVVQLGHDVVAVGARCTHYKGPLAEGLVAGETVRCPWHHACFNLRTGEAVRAPALDPIACWRVERHGDRIVVKEKLPATTPAPSSTSKHPASVVIVGGGAAGQAAAEMLRREGYRGDITMISADGDPPIDRPNLSKDYLAGNAPEDWMPLREDDFFRDQNITLRLNTRVASVDAAGRVVVTAHGDRIPYGALLAATGAFPVTLDVPGASDPRVHYLRTFADSRAIIAALKPGMKAAVVGASFIGLEVAASLRARDVDVHVIAPEARPLERVLGPQVGDFIRGLHESKGVVFHLSDGVVAIEPRSVKLKTGASVDADIVIVGIGVRPAIGWLESAGVAMDHGVTVNEYLETSVPGIFAAGDLARWPDPHSGGRIRVEHWVVAERMGQTAACNILGRRTKFETVPFFWSQHYDTTINYVGHADRWDAIHVDGDIHAQDCALRYMKNGRVAAVATIGRDQESLRAEVDLENDRNESQKSKVKSQK
jgi:NADPH-dependent 2,4-dienoyl-CoA reductase/sulfur reductase-like enzyme/nitrite reductase/ring-hydroxylating ferredoxin subunit